MLGIATAIIGELITGKGALAQLGFETGIPILELEPIILAGIAFNLVRAASLWIVCSRHPRP